MPDPGYAAARKDQAGRDSDASGVEIATTEIREASRVESREPGRATMEGERDDLLSHWHRLTQSVISSAAWMLVMAALLVLIEATIAWATLQGKVAAASSLAHPGTWFHAWHAQVAKLYHLADSDAVVSAGAVLALAASINIALAVSPEPSYGVSHFDVSEQEKERRRERDQRLSHWRLSMKVVAVVAGTIISGLLGIAAFSVRPGDLGGFLAAGALAMLSILSTATIVSTAGILDEDREAERVTRKRLAIDGKVKELKEYLSTPAAPRDTPRTRRTTRIGEGSPGIYRRAAVILGKGAVVALVPFTASLVVSGFFTKASPVDDLRSLAHWKAVATLLWLLSVYTLTVDCALVGAMWSSMNYVSGGVAVRWRSYLWRALWLCVAGWQIVRASGISGHVILGLLTLGPVAVWAMFWAAKRKKSVIVGTRWLTRDVFTMAFEALSAESHALGAPGPPTGRDLPPKVVANA